jgi:predicted kinase
VTTGLLRLLIAPPGAGKSHWCTEHSGRIGSVFSLDAARAELGRHAHDHAVNPAAVDAVTRAMADVLLSGGEVTLDATSTVRAHRAQWLALARRYRATPVAVVLRVRLEVALARNAVRTRPVPPAALTQMWHEVDELTAAQLRLEGFADVTELGSRHLAHQL